MFERNFVFFDGINHFKEEILQILMEQTISERIYFLCFNGINDIRRGLFVVF